MRVFLRLDETIDGYVEVEYGITDLVSDIGGIASIVYAIFRSIAGNLSHNLLVASLIQNMFRAKSKLVQPLAGLSDSSTSKFGLECKGRIGTLQAGNEEKNSY